MNQFHICSTREPESVLYRNNVKYTYILLSKMEAKIITLDVGGTIFKINQKHLLKSEFFQNLFEDCSYGEPIFIDRCPHIFKHVLGYLRDNTYPYPKRYSFELDFFLIKN